MLVVYKHKRMSRLKEPRVEVGQLDGRTYTGYSSPYATIIIAFVYKQLFPYLLSSSSSSSSYVHYVRLKLTGLMRGSRRSLSVYS